MSFEVPQWTDRIAVEEFDGVPYRIYAERPHRSEQILTLADRWDERPHLIQDERVVTFAGLRRGAADKANLLVDMGVGRGDPVMLLGWNSPDWVINYWACVQIGAVPVLANAWWGESEISYALTLIRPVLVLADARTESKVPASCPRGTWAANESANADVVWPAVDVNAHLPGENETAVIVFTSGTEGLAKAVELSHRALLSGLQMMLHITKQLPPRFDATKSEIALHTGPLFHVGGPQVMLRSVAMGNTLIFPSGRYEAADVLKFIERYKVTRWSAVPTMLNRLLDHPDLTSRDLSSLRSLGTGGAPVSNSLLERLRTSIPNAKLSVSIGYGLTENTGPATTSSGADTLKYPGTCGRPLPCVEIRIEPQAGLPDGEVLIRSPSLMSGYFGMDQSPIDRNGWLHTGDLGKMDEAGRLWITGRCKDMIIRGGENIAPAAVESALMALPGVVEAAVFGIPHTDLGEEVMAVVVVEGERTTEAFKEQLRGQVASFAIPSRWHLQTEPLPTNQTGKVDKAALKSLARLAAQAEAVGAEGSGHG